MKALYVPDSTGIEFNDAVKCIEKFYDVPLLTMTFFKILISFLTSVIIWAVCDTSECKAFEEVV